MENPPIIGLWISWFDDADERSVGELVLAASRALEENDIKILSRDEWPKQSRIRYSREVDIAQDSE